MNKKGGLGKWFGEEWIDVKTGKPCGRKSAKGKWSTTASGKKRRTT